MDHHGKRVIVVGGGYAGIGVAQGLDDIADVVLVEPKDMFVHHIAALRAIVDPEWLERTYFRYDRLLEHGQVVQGRAALVDSSGVTLASGERLEADFIVLSSGSAYPFPAKCDVTEGADAQQQVRRVHEELTASEHVLVIGAGPVGVELAGEIKAVWPEKRVTVLDAAPDVLGGRFTPALRHELRRQLSAMGVGLLLGTPVKDLPSAPVGVKTPLSVATADGGSISADIWFKCFGVAPSSDYLGGSLADARRADGFIEVGPLLQVKGHDHVFALGDVSAASDHKLAAHAFQQIQVVITNLRAKLIGGETVRYQEPPEGIMIPLGPRGGVGQLPGQEGLVAPDDVSQKKGRELGVARFATQLGYPVPARVNVSEMA